MYAEQNQTPYCGQKSKLSRKPIFGSASKAKLTAAQFSYRDKRSFPGFPTEACVPSRGLQAKSRPGTQSLGPVLELQAKMHLDSYAG